MSMAWVNNKLVFVAGPELHRQALRLTSERIETLRKDLSDPYAESRDLQMERKALARIEALGNE